MNGDLAGNRSSSGAARNVTLKLCKNFKPTIRPQQHSLARRHNLSQISALFRLVRRLRFENGIRGLPRAALG